MALIRILTTDSYHGLEGPTDCTGYLSGLICYLPLSSVLLQSQWPFYYPLCVWICSHLRASLIHAISLSEMLFASYPCGQFSHVLQVFTQIMIRDAFPDNSV